MSTLEIKAIPFKKGDIVRYNTGYVAKVVNVVGEKFLILDNDNAGNPGMSRVDNTGEFDFVKIQ